MSLYADSTRQLKVLDPTSRQLIISCGCALINARVSLAADGFDVAVSRLPDPAQPDLLATVTPIDRGTVDADLAELDSVIELRHTNRRMFAGDAVPEEALGRLERAASVEGVELFVVRNADQRLTVARLAQHADDIENLNPAYRAELRMWTTDDPERPDGVPSGSVPHVDAGSFDEVPIRDFDTRGDGGLPTMTRSSREQTLVLLCTEYDHPLSWLRAGEGLERALLKITKLGLVASPLTQITEVPSARAELRAELGLALHPHVLLRIGYAAPTPATRRRQLVDVLVEEP